MYTMSVSKCKREKNEGLDLFGALTLEIPAIKRAACFPLLVSVYFPARLSVTKARSDSSQSKREIEKGKRKQMLECWRSNDTFT